MDRRLCPSGAPPPSSLSSSCNTQSSCRGFFLRPDPPPPPAPESVVTPGSGGGWGHHTQKTRQAASMQKIKKNADTPSRRTNPHRGVGVGDVEVGPSLSQWLDGFPLGAGIPPFLLHRIFVAHHIYPPPIISPRAQSLGHEERVTSPKSSPTLKAIGGTFVPTHGLQSGSRPDCFPRWLCYHSVGMALILTMV